MKLLDLIFVFVGLSTFIIFSFQIEWLFDRRKFLIILLFDCLLFALSYLLIYLSLGNPQTVVALKMPLISSLVFYLLCDMFRSNYKRNPVNTAFSFTKQPIEDVIFSMLFVLLGVGVPTLIVF